MQIKLQSLQDSGQINVDNYNAISRETNRSFEKRRGDIWNEKKLILNKQIRISSMEISI